MSVIRRVAMLAAAGWLLTQATVPSVADYEGRMIGNWMVSATEDRFGDGGTYVAATAKDGHVLAVRCLRKELSLAVVNRRSSWKSGDYVGVAFRIDRLERIDTIGIVIDDGLIQIAAEPDLVKQMRDGNEAAMRLEIKDVVTTLVYKLRGSSKAFADLQKECPLDAPTKKGDAAAAPAAKRDASAKSVEAKPESKSSPFPDPRK